MNATYWGKQDELVGITTRHKLLKDSSPFLLPPPTSRLFQLRGNSNLFNLFSRSIESYCLRGFVTTRTVRYFYFIDISLKRVEIESCLDDMRHCK